MRWGGVNGSNTSTKTYRVSATHPENAPIRTGNERSIADISRNGQSGRRCLHIYLHGGGLVACSNLDEDKYLFRRRPTAEAVRVTAEERREIFRRFRSAYWKSHAVLWGISIAAITLAATVAVLLEAPDDASTIIDYGFAVLLLVGFLYVDRRVFDEAADAVADRPAAKPPRRWSDIQTEHLQKAPWWRILAGGAFLGILAVLTFPVTYSSTWAAVAWFCYFGFCLVMWLRNIRRKRRTATV